MTNILRKKTKRALEIWREKGFRGIERSLDANRRKISEARKYQKWIRQNALTDEDRKKIRREISNFTLRPKISVVLPVYNIAEKWLRLCVESVLKQLYENWELCIADDASPSAHIKKVLEEYAARDERIKLVFRAENGHISAASNSALELATGEFVALLDHDDELSEDALFYVAKEINEHSDAQMIYSDEDLIDERGRRYEPKFKPDWSRDFFYSLNLITHLSVYRTAVLRRIGGFQTGAEGSQDYDLAMRVVEQISENQIRHISRILYHWRAIRGSVAFSSDEKPYAHERARDALRAHLARCGKQATVSRAAYNLHRVRYDLPAPPPKVSLVFSAGDEQAIENFVEQTDYEHLQTIKIADGENKNEADRLNRAALDADGDVLCFVDTNLQPLDKNWLKELVGFAAQTEIGAVGAKILDADKTILDGGLIIGASGAVGVAHRGLPREASGYFLRAQLVNNFSAVSASCLAVRRELFEAIGGFDAETFPNRFFDADFCLRLREKNYRVAFTPYAELMKTDETRRTNLERNPTDEEKESFVKRWSERVECDAFYNPNLSKRDASFSIDI